MTTFGTRLKQLRLENDLKQAELVTALQQNYGRSISVSMLSKWENGKEEPQKFSDVTMLAKYFGVSGDYLIGTSDSKYGDDRRVAELEVMEIENTLDFNNNGNVKDYEPVRAKDEVDLCVRAYDNSMIGARIYKDDHVFIHKQKIFNDKDVVLVSYGNSLLIRRINLVAGGTLLLPENPEFTTNFILDKSKDTFRVMGKVLYVKSEVK